MNDFELNDNAVFIIEVLASPRLYNTLKKNPEAVLGEDAGNATQVIEFVDKIKGRLIKESDVILCAKGLGGGCSIA